MDNPKPLALASIEHSIRLVSAHYSGSRKRVAVRHLRDAARLLDDDAWQQHVSAIVGHDPKRSG